MVGSYPPERIVEECVYCGSVRLLNAQRSVVTYSPDRLLIERYDFAANKRI